MIEMTALELNEYIANNSNIVLIDVRETWEYNVKRLDKELKPHDSIKAVILISICP